MIGLLFITSIVLFTSFLLNERVIRPAGCVSSLLAFFLLACAQVIASELLLGLAAALFFRNLVMLNLAILLSVWLLTKDALPLRSSWGVKGKIAQLLQSKVALLFVSLICGFGLVKVAMNLVNPPFGWDSLNYHFTFPVEWLKSGTLYNPITIADDPSPTYYPMNGSLLFLWLIMPLRNVFLADLGQAPFFVLALAAVFGIARLIGLDRLGSLCAAGLFLLIPNFFKQLEIAYVDVILASFFLTCVYFLLLLETVFSWQHVFLYSLGLGLLLGLKTVALPYSLLLLLPFAYLAIKHRKPHFLILCIGLVAIFGGFTYIRNFLETGNPLYPLDVRFGGREIFKGVMDTATYAAHFKKGDYSLAKILFHEGLGGQTLLFVLPFSCLGLPIAWAKKRKQLSVTFVYVLLMPVFIYLVYRYLIPLANVRYLYPLLGLGMVIGFFSLKATAVPFSWVRFFAVLCAVESGFEIARHTELFVSLMLATLFFFLFLGLRGRGVLRYFRNPLRVCLVAVFVVCALLWLEKYYLRHEYKRYSRMIKYSGFWPDATGAWEWLDSVTSGNSIAYTGRPVPFPLYGSGFKNNVSYVSVNAVEPAKLHYFPSSYYRWGYDFSGLHKELERDGNYRSRGSYPVWLMNLSLKNVDYLFVYSLHQTREIDFPVEDTWARAHPERFRPAFTNTTVHIYRILK